MANKRRGRCIVAVFHSDSFESWLKSLGILKALAHIELVRLYEAGVREKGVSRDLPLPQIGPMHRGRLGNPVNILTALLIAIWLLQLHSDGLSLGQGVSDSRAKGNNTWAKKVVTNHLPLLHKSASQKPEVRMSMWHICCFKQQLWPTRWSCYIS